MAMSLKKSHSSSTDGITTSAHKTPSISKPHFAASETMEKRTGATNLVVVTLKWGRAPFVGNCRRHSCAVQEETALGKKAQKLRRKPPLP